MLEQSKQLKRRLQRDSSAIRRLTTEVEELKSERSRQALHLAGAIMLLKRARNGLSVDTEIFEQINRFLKQEVADE